MQAIWHENQITKLLPVKKIRFLRTMNWGKGNNIAKGTFLFEKENLRRFFFALRSTLYEVAMLAT